jgi:GTP-binding protein
VNIEASFLLSAASASDLPRDGLAEIALVGRSNVGKSSLINALVRRSVARTSGAPGKTRLANIYRVARGQAPAIYMIDLPGYGFARGGSTGFDELAQAVFGRDRQERQNGRAPAVPPAQVSALLLVDARHPGLDSDLKAWTWLRQAAARPAVVATKIDKLARGERIRAMRQLESVFADSVLPVSAVTGEGLDELWKLIDSLVNRPRPNSSRPSRPRSPRRPPPSRATAQPRLTGTTRALHPPKK